MPVIDQIIFFSFCFELTINVLYWISSVSEIIFIIVFLVIMWGQVISFLECDNLKKNRIVSYSISSEVFLALREYLVSKQDVWIFRGLIAFIMFLHLCRTFSSGVPLKKQSSFMQTCRFFHILGGLSVCSFFFHNCKYAILFGILIIGIISIVQKLHK